MLNVVFAQTVVDEFCQCLKSLFDTFLFSRIEVYAVAFFHLLTLFFVGFSASCLFIHCVNICYF